MDPAIDTIRMGGRVSSVDSTCEGWSFGGRVGPGGSFMVSSRRRQLDGGAMLDVMTGRDGMSAWVEGSAPKALQGGVNFPGVSTAEAVDVGLRWLGEAAEWVKLSEAPRVNRLDVVRDFQVGPERVTEILRGVGAMTSGGRAVRALYRDASAQRALTVWARTKRAGGGRLYDKQAESGAAEALGIIRFEAQERTATLRRVGVERAEHLATDDAADLLRARWGWTGFGARVLPFDRLSDLIWQDTTLRPDTRLKLVGWIALGTPKLSRRETEWRYRSRLSVYGQCGEVDGGWRLDLDEGLLAA